MLYKKPIILPQSIDVTQQKLNDQLNNLGKDALSTWKTILKKHETTRENQVVELFHRGLEKLAIHAAQIPNLSEVNSKLEALTGFRGVFVDGLEDTNSFFRMLSRRQFPIGNFIRDRQDLSYTPAPDIVHDLYGHLPFFVDKDYADFCQKFGELACKFLDRKDLLRQFERFFWFTIEFGLIKTEKGIRVFGAGIASSTGECEYALSGKPEIIPFAVDVIRKQEFRIDEMQKKLFLLDSPEQLYKSLNELYLKVEKDRREISGEIK